MKKRRMYNDILSGSTRLVDVFDGCLQFLMIHSRWEKVDYFVDEWEATEDYEARFYLVWDDMAKVMSEYNDEHKEFCVHPHLPDCVGFYDCSE